MKLGTLLLIHISGESTSKFFSGPAFEAVEVFPAQRAVSEVGQLGLADAELGADVFIRKAEVYLLQDRFMARLAMSIGILSTRGKISPVLPF